MAFSIFGIMFFSQGWIHLRHGSGIAVVIHHDAVEHSGVGLAGPVGLEVFLQKVDGLGHLFHCRSNDVFCIVCHNILF